MARTRGRTIVGAVAAVTLAAIVPVGAQETPGIPAVAVSSNNMEWVANQPNLGGTNLEFFERLEADGSVRRYAAAATHGNGFDIIDVTDPEAPTTVGRYVSPARAAGFNFHVWLDVNAKRDIVILSVQEPGFNATHGGSPGLEFVDISDVANPIHLGQISGLGGPRKVYTIGDDHVYTTVPTHIVDYSDPEDPVDLGRPSFCGTGFFEDPNNPGRTYVGGCTLGTWWIVDTSDPANPTVITEVRNLDVAAPNEIFPAPDSSFVGVSDLRALTHSQCPGGGIHFYDISGKYVPGATLEDPREIGTWFAPFGGADIDRDSAASNWGPCTIHNWNMAPERTIVAAGLLSGGTWVMDPTEAPKNLEGGGLYDEWDGEPGRGLGPTTWGNTNGNFLAQGDVPTASQWLPFALTDPEHERLVFTNGLLGRGLDVYRYTGPMPKKLSRLHIDAQAVGGAVTGALDRYAVLTHDGWVNEPLAAKEITVEAPATGATVAVVTDSDGSFSADLGLAPGSHEVTVTWAGDERFEETTVSRMVTV